MVRPCEYRTHNESELSLLATQIVKPMPFSDPQGNEMCQCPMAAVWQRSERGQNGGVLASTLSVRSLSILWDVIAVVEVQEAEFMRYACIFPIWASYDWTNAAL